MAVSRTGMGHLDHSFGCSLGILVLDAIRCLLSTRPLEEYRHEKDKVPAYQLPYTQRYFWLTGISQRGIGWSFKADHGVPSVESYHLTRRAFITSRLCRIFIYYLLFEVVQLYIRCNPVFSSDAHLLSQGYFLGWLNIMAIPWRCYTGLNWMHSALAVVAVGTTLHEPQSWPPPFGKWKDAYTVRRFWGRTWHQFSRYILTLFGPHQHKRHPWDQPSSSDAKTKEREPWVKSYTRLCNAFLCSAFMHTCGDVVLQFRIWETASPITTSLHKASQPNVIGFSIPCFLLQPIGVLVEDAVMEAGKRIGLRKRGWMKAVGYLWVSLWISYSAHSLVQGQKNAILLAYPVEGGGVEDGITVLERVANKLFGIDLAATIRSWFLGCFLN
ncbi:membrane bound O-acyl transferase family-domain-containing protein [Pisolithus thermaeus]|nr:membrane bound O-acyl transferase family-domain-containing protein [Pisolithus croceorrhizus]KAI6151374.1 membrane bound O-acyl transferase family-domain-containing protein [Pisolithus thermaeus]